MKASKKILNILIAVIMMFLMVSNVAYAEDDNLDSWASSYINSAKKESGNFKGANTSDAATSTQKIMGALLTVIRVVGTGVALIMIVYIGIKYMSAAPDDKAEFKKSAVAYVVGAVVLFAGSNLIAIIANFATNNI